jgi:hypothetical protein
MHEDCLSQTVAVSLFGSSQLPVPKLKLKENIVNRALKSLLKTALFAIDQIDRASDQVSDLTERGKAIVNRQQNHTLRSVVSFAIGASVGVGMGLLFAPASGNETRNSISEKVRDIGDRVGERLRTELPSTGTESV